VTIKCALWNHAAFIENGRAGAIKTAPESNTTNIKNSTCQRIATVIVAISRRLINFRGKTRALTTMLRCLEGLDTQRTASFAQAAADAMPSPPQPMPCHHRLLQRGAMSWLASTLVQRRGLCSINIDT
jgi:hypothetical protein